MHKITHYDLGNDFYTAMLDQWMIYTCGHWDSANNLARAQEAKLDLICRKLQFQHFDSPLRPEPAPSKTTKS